MKRVCTQCDRISVDGNLWCQERDCPAGAMSAVFSYGDFLGDLEITRLVRVISTASIYEAKRGKDKVLLKVAHDSCQEQLKREAAVLAQVSGEHAMLPILLPPYPNADTKQRPYGKTVFRDETKYFEVFQYASGEFLRDILQKNPQPWYLHAAWMITSIADAIAYLHLKVKRLHLNISPDVIYVRFDKQGIPRPLLLDLGVVSDMQGTDIPWLLQHGQPAYTAPELIERGAPSVTSDVYGLGLVLYEMLAGHSLFPYVNHRADEVRQLVIRARSQPLNRSDLADEILNTVYQAVDRNPGNRQPDVRTFAKVLRSKFGEVPAEKKPADRNRKILAGLVFAILIISGLVLLTASLG